MLTMICCYYCSSYFCGVAVGVYGQLRQDPQTKKTHPTTEVKLNWKFWAILFITLFNYPVQRNQFLSLPSWY